MNGVDPEASLLQLECGLSSSKHSLPKIGVAEVQRSASQSSRYFDTKPGEEVKAMDLSLAYVAGSSDKWLVMGVIAVNV